MQKTLLFAALQTGLAGAGDSDAGAEWTQGELCKLKALHPKGDTDDGDAEQQPVQRSGNGKGKSAEQQPQQVHQQRGRTSQDPSNDHQTQTRADCRVISSSFSFSITEGFLSCRYNVANGRNISEKKKTNCKKMMKRGKMMILPEFLQNQL